MNNIHVIAPMKHPGGVVRHLLKEEEYKEDITILDLSAGQLNAPSSLGKNIRNAAQKKSITWIDGQSFALEMGDKSREAYLEWLSQMSNMKLAYGKSIKEFFTYRHEVSLWWFRPMAVKHPVDHPYRWLFYMIFVVEHLATSTSRAPSSWKFWVADAATGKALKAAVQNYSSAPVHVMKASSALQGHPRYNTGFSSVYSRIRGVLLNLIKVFNRLWQPLQAAWFSHRKLRHRKKDFSQDDCRKGECSEKPLVLVQTKFPQSWFEGVAGASETETEHADYYFGDAPWRLQGYGFRVGWLPSMHPRDYDLWEEQRDRQSLPDALSWMKLSWMKLPGLYVHLLKWELLYLWLFEIKRVHQQWQYEGIPLGYWLKKEYAAACWLTRPLIEIETCRSACEALEPEAVLYRDEFYGSGRQLAVAVGKVPSLLTGVQHGMISRDHTVYQFKESDLQMHSCEESMTSSECTPDYIYHCPVPDIFASFGAYYQDLFENWEGYPEERVFSIGGLRHDALFDRFLENEKVKRSKREDLRRSLGIPSDDKVVLLCTGPASLAGEWFEMVLQCLEEATLSAFVAVKLHQYHGGESFVHDVAEARGFEKYSVFKRSVYELIFGADVLVTSTSTTILESRLLETPVVPIVADEFYESYPFTKEHLGVPVSDYVAMAEVLHDALQDRGRFSSERLKRNRWNVLKRHLHNEDGKACKRLAKLIRGQCDS